MPNDTADGAACPTCQGNEKMRRQIDQEADELARERFRTWVVMYIAYPAVILSLLGVIGVGTLLYLKKGDPSQQIVSTEPIWCGSPVGSVTAYLPPSSSQGGYESAVPSSPMPGYTPPPIDIGGGFGRTIQGATAAMTDRLSAHVFESIRAADGSPEARYRRDMVGLSQIEMGVSRQRFADRSRRDGKLGYYRLGIAQLGADAYEIAAKRDLSVPFCRPNDFAIADKSQAYFNFAVAKACDTASATRADDWLQAIAEHGSFSPERAAALEMEARNYVAGQSEVCLAQLADTTTTSTSPGYGDSEAEDTEPLPMPPAPTPGATSATERRDGERGDEQLFASYARQLLNLGDAALAEGRMRRARRYWLRAIDVGKAFGAQASIEAQKRLQTHTLTCHFTDESLKAISRDYKARSGDLIHIKVIQQALHALGHYDGPITGNVGPVTRASIRKFQGEMEFDETDTLTPIQTVYLVCNAAETARDLPSQNALGIMYATGLGVEQNIDLALEWLRAASTRRFADATFNLSILYGTGIVLKSYRLCDIPRSLDQADQYLREAAQQGHFYAADLMRRHAGKSPKDRWKAIEEELGQRDKSGVYSSRLASIGASCQPDRNDR